MEGVGVPNVRPIPSICRRIPPAIAFYLETDVNETSSRKVPANEART